MFQSFLDDLHAALQHPLPGEQAQYKLSPMGRPRRSDALKTVPNPKKSAVLVLLYPHRDSVHTVLMLRNAYKGVHSAQVSFPGGKHEDSDPDLQFTALREAEEELGIDPSAVDVLQPLTQVYIPPSGFLVDPYLAVTHERPNFRPDSTEVQQVIEAPVELFTTPNAIQRKAIELSNGVKLQAPYFDVHGHTVWGATAMMLGELRALLSLVQKH